MAPSPNSGDSKDRTALREPNQSLRTEGVLPAEADRIPSDQLRDTHVPHPDAPLEFKRSALLVGVRGAGKTFLLRHRRHCVQHGALYINLRVELQSLARAYGIGSQAADLPADLELLVRRQAIALVGLAIARELLDNEPSVTSFDSALLEPLIPKHCRPTTRWLDITSLSDLRRAVRASPDESWLDEALLSADLVEFLLELHHSLDLSLTVFLDRADDVPAAAVSPLVGLLDQSAPYILVIAGRPAVAHAIPSLHDSGAVPTDHYDVIHLGVEPYSEAWQEFSSEAVTRYLAANNVQLADGPTFRWCYRLGRDSLRRSARLVQVALATGDDLDLRTRQVAQMKATLLAKVRGEMRTLHPDFPAYLRSLRDQAGPRLSSGPQVALEVEIEGTRAAFDLLGERDQFSLALLRAIRSEALCLPQGMVWHPYELPNRFEILPLIAWDGRNTAWIQL
jgi:hypothetical protein